MLSLLPVKPQLVCEICKRVASCCNYGVSSCNACKMFFRRAVVFEGKFTCRKKNQCFDNIPPGAYPPNCQACRIEKCKAVGMTFAPRNISEFSFDSKSDDLLKLIGQLRTRDVRRTNILTKQYTSENINLREMVENKKSVKLVTKDPHAKLTTDEWTFIYTFSTADFLMSLNFMQNLQPADKLKLIESFAYKASIAFYAMGSMKNQSDQFITPDGGESLPQVIVDMFKNSKGFCERLRGLLISKFIELKITNEELLLLVCVLFCNPAVPSLSEHAIKVITDSQQVYCDSLLKLCLNAHQQSGPSRFMDLLSLCHVINRNYEQLQSAAIMCVLNKPDYQFPRIIDKVFDFSDSSDSRDEKPSGSNTQ